jgi:hypothetical protein
MTLSSRLSRIYWATPRKLLYSQERTYLNEDGALSRALQQNNVSVLSAVLFFKLMLAFVMGNYVQCEMIYDELHS